jgi:hypothetical protein
MTMQKPQPKTTTSAEVPEIDDPEVKLYPHLTRFYGIPFETLLDMPRPVVRLYVDAMSGIRAQEQFQAIEAATFPHLEKQSDRGKIIRRYERAVGMEEEEHSEELNFAALASMGIAIEGAPDA